jgi:hypothetical protein
MKKKIDELHPKLGQFIRVNNMEKATAKTSQEKFKYGRENDRYVSLQIEDLDGDGERCLLFTYLEHTDMEFIELSDDKLVFGRLYPSKIANKPCFLIKTKHWDGRVRILRVSASQLVKADARARRHPKTVTKKPAMVNMFD